MDDADDDPHGFEARLLAVLGRGPGASPRGVDPGLPPAGERGAAAAAKDRAVPGRRAEAPCRDRFDPRARQPHWNGVGLWVDLVRVPPFGTWDQPRADLYGLASDWLGDPPDVSEEEGVDHLVRRYLAAFGPASRADVVGFTGIPARVLSAAFERISAPPFPRRGRQGAVDVRGAPLPDPETPAPIRFLPAWDATLLTHARRTQILPERYRPRVFNTKTPHSIHTFLVDGQVAGSWRHERGGSCSEPFERPSAKTRRALDDEAAFLADLFATG